MRLLGMPWLAAFVLLALPAGASGATVTLTPPDYDVEEFYAVVDVEDDAREPNDLDVDNRRYGRATIRELGDAPLVAGEGCRQQSERVVKCGPIDEIVAVVVRAGGRNDAVRCRGRDGVLRGGPGDDTLTAKDDCRLDLAGERGDDRLVGGTRGDRLIGGAGRDTLVGHAGDDRLYGDGVGDGHGRDALDGGGGVDTVVFAGEHRGVHVDLHRGRGPDRDRLRRIEDVIGSRKDDVLVGDEGPNRLRGGGGAQHDRLDGRGGNDVLEEGGRVRCGAGRDVVRYPGRALLGPSCELMWDFQYLDFERVPIFPRALRDNRVAVPAVCHGDIAKCRHRAVIMSGGAELGHSRTVPSSKTDFVTWVQVRLARPLPSRQPVVIETYTSEYDPLENGGDGWSGFFEFSWRIRCRGGPDCRGPG